jgi:hypothetical protein
MKKFTLMSIFVLFSAFITLTLKAEINFDLSSAGGVKVMDYDAVTTEKNKAQAERWITVANFGASGTSGKCGTATKTFDIKSGRTIDFFLAKCDRLVITANIASGRSLKVNIDDGAAITLSGTGACVDYTVEVNKEVPVKIRVQGGSSSSSWTSFFTFYYEEKVPKITGFQVNGLNADINETTRLIKLELPYGTNLSSLTPTVTINSSANAYSPTGAQDFGADTVVYSAMNLTDTVFYNAVITAKASADTVKTITSLTINGKSATINQSTGVITYDFASFEGPLANWAVAFTLGSVTSVANFTSGSSYDFALNNTLAITVTAQDNSTKVYNVTPTVSTKKNIGLLTVNGQAESYDNLFLSAFSDYYITYLKADATAPADINVFFNKYDLLVFHANVSGTNATGVASKNMVGVKPILNLKAFFYNSGRWSWSTNTPQNAAAGSSSADVAINLQNHPIFVNVNFSGTTLTYYDGLPGANTNSIQYASDLGTLAGFTSHTIATSNTSGIQIHEIQDNVAAKYLMIGLSMENNNYTYFNSNTINLLKNSADYLTNLSSKYNYNTTGLLNQTSETIYFKNEKIFNPESKSLSVFNATGVKLISSNLKEIDIHTLPHGVYFISNPGAKTTKIIR